MKRYDLIDTLRGLAVISMIGFHTCWLMSFFGMGIDNETLFGPGFTAWERSICISFILIAGYSFSLGRAHLRSGLTVFITGLVITAVTCLFLPELRIIFGVLTFIGTASLLMIPLDRVAGERALKSRAFRWTGLVLFIILFLLTYNINNGYLGFKRGIALDLPETLYKGYIATFIGFKDPDFYSSDYFSLLPWIFLYLTGYFLHKTIKGSELEKRVLTSGIPGIKAIGRHSLVIYVLHPIVIYAVLYFIH